MKQKGHQGEHSAVYHFGAYPQWTTPALNIIYIIETPRYSDVYSKSNWMI